jgi:hypothetical protein
VPSGGLRAGAGRPVKSTPRQSITVRLPIHLLTQATNRAEIEGLGFTEIVERALEAYLKRKLQKRRAPRPT